MKDINLKNKKKIDNNCQCLCHFDTKQLLSSVKYCDRCIEIHKTEPISPFKPNGWEETEKVLLKSFRDSCVIGFHTIGIGTVPCWINDVIKPLLSQAILSAEKETVKRCIEALPKKKELFIQVYDNSSHRYQIPWSKRDDWFKWCEIPENDERSLETPEWAKRIDGMPLEDNEPFNSAIDQATKALLSLPDQEQLKIKK